MHSNFTINALISRNLFGFLNALKRPCEAMEIMDVHLYIPYGTIIVYQCIIML